MADFLVHFNGLSVASADFDRIISDINSVSKQSREIYKNLKRSVSVKIPKSAAIISSINKCAEQVNSLRNVLDNSCNNYKMSELLPCFQSAGGLNYEMIKQVFNDKSFINSEIGELLLLSIPAEAALLDDERKLKFAGETKNKYEDGKTDIWRSKHNINDKTPWSKEKGKIGVTYDDEKSVSLFSGEVEGSGKYADGSANVDVCKAEAHYSGFAGAGYYEDADGKKRFRVGVSGEVGASVSVLSAAAAGRVGLGENHDLLGLNGDAKIDVGKVAGKVKGSCYLGPNPEIYVEGELEAVAVEASASGGITVLGTDVNVNGSVKIGIGAHCKAGLTNGKLKVDIGAAVGIGFSLGFEVDVSGTMDYLTGAAEKISGGAKKAWDTLTSWF